MSTGFVYCDRFLEHDTGEGHPERPDRLRAIVDRLKRAYLWNTLEHLEFEPVDLQWVERLHDARYVRRIRGACEAGERFIDSPDSAICPDSFEIARLATGGVLRAVDAVIKGEVDNAFCAVRPPGHHAERDRSMGFCLFDHVAIAADYALQQHRLERVAILDFDVHHGNGTQHLLEHRRDVLFVSLHEHPSYLYPGTGFGWETGQGDGEGYTVNVPLDPASDDEAYRHAFVFHATPALERFEPQLLLVSAGFDAAAADPLAHMRVTPEGFMWIARHLKATAERLCHGRIVSVLEGGYDLDALSESVALYLGAMMQPPGEDGLMAMKAGF